MKLLTRDYGVAFEAKNGLRDFASRLGFPSRAVYWDSVRTEDEWHEPENIFRKGDQSNLLVWDKHTDQYRDSDSKRDWEELARR